MENAEENCDAKKEGNVEEENQEQMHYINTLQGLKYLMSARLSQYFKTSAVVSWTI